MVRGFNEIFKVQILFSIDTQFVNAGTCERVNFRNAKKFPGFNCSKVPKEFKVQTSFPVDTQLLNYGTCERVNFGNGLQM